MNVWRQKENDGRKCDTAEYIVPPPVFIQRMGSVFCLLYAGERGTMKKTNDFGRDPVHLLVIKTAIPFMVAQYVNVLYSIVDRIYVGNIPKVGAYALAGVGVCAPVTAFLASFGTLFGIGGSVLFAMRMGAKDERTAGRLMSDSFIFLTITSVILTVLFLVLKDRLLILFGASEKVFPYADKYVTICTAGTFFALIAGGMNYFITAQGFPVLGMSTTVIGAVINIALDPVFIFVFHMGVSGAAAATVIAQICSCIFVLTTLCKKKMPVRLKPGRPDVFRGRKIVKIGISPFLILATDSLIIIALNAVLQVYGGKSRGDMLITSATIVQSYMQLITSPMIGITGGAQPIISYNYGAGRPDRIRKTVFCLLMFCFCFTGIMFLLSRVAPDYFVRIFTSEPEYIDLSVWGIKTFTLMIIPLSFQYVIVDSVTALGMPRISLSLSLIRKGMYFAFTCIIPLFFAAKYVFYAEPAADGAAACLSCAVYAVIYRKYLKGEGNLGKIKM